MMKNSDHSSFDETKESCIKAHRGRKLDRFWALGEEYVYWLFEAEEFYSEKEDNLKS